MTTPTKTATRRGALKTLAGGAAAATLPLWARYTHAQSAEPIRIGFQQHRTGIFIPFHTQIDPPACLPAQK